MKVTRGQIILRGLTNRCPNCGGRTLFKEGTLFQVNPSCPRCGLRIERDEGGFLGALSLNYGVTLVCFLTPIAIITYLKLVSVQAAAVLAVIGALGVPALLYRPSRSWWLMNYYLVLPHHLPANMPELKPGEDDNV